MKKKTGIIQKTWTLQTKVKVENKVIGTLTADELAMLIWNDHEMKGLQRAIGDVQRRYEFYVDQAAEKYGFERGHACINLKTGEITKLF